jgi:hypothetical protein
MLVVIVILYVGTTVSPPLCHRCWRDLDSILYTLSRVRTLFVTRWFFSQDQRVFILEHNFSIRSYAERQNGLEILSQTLQCQISLQVLSSVSVKPGVLVRNVILVILLF